MKKLRLIAAVAIAGAFMMLSTGAAQAYPDTNLTLSADSPVVGGKVTNFEANADVTCDTLTVSFSDGKASSETTTRTGHDVDTLTGSYVTKAVDEKTSTTMTATCTYDDTNVVAPAKAKSSGVVPAFYSTKTGSTLQAATQNLHASAVVVLLPKGGDDGNGVLPNTGGLRLSLLVIGGLLVLVGVGVTVASRRRNTTH
jgi:LPXTG-motif cell wall-anchored protein